METSEVLYVAANLIEERGWGKGPHAWGADGPLCIEGGIIAALGYSGWEDADLKIDAFHTCPSYVAVMDYLERGAVNDMERTLWWWNDDDQRTAEQVIETLRACAVIEAAKESPALELAAPVAAVGSAG